MRKFPHSLRPIRGLGSEKCRTKLSCLRLEEDCNRTPDNFPFHFDMTGLGGYSNLTGFCEKDTHADPRYEPTLQLGSFFGPDPGGTSCCYLGRSRQLGSPNPTRMTNGHFYFRGRAETRWFEIENYEISCNKE